MFAGSISMAPFDVTFQKLLADINQLPPNELSYYLVLLMAALHKAKHQKRAVHMLEKIDDLVIALNRFYQEKTPESLDKVITKIEALSTFAKINTFSMHIKKIIFTLCSVMTAMIGGMLGAVIGLSAGLLSELNFLHGAKTGFITGFGIGALMGLRTPDRLLRSTLENKLLHCLHHVKKIGHELHDNHLAEKPYNHHQNETKKYIINTFFQDEKDKERAFVEFLKSSQSFQVCTTPSQLVDRTLDGTVGHHALIRFKINGKVALPLEYGGRQKNPRWVDQAEAAREVSGQKLFEMITLHRTLQETHERGLHFVLTSFKAGDNDCHTYVNKILIGTQQKPAIVKRFAPEIDTWVGRHIVKHCVRFASEMSDNELAVIAPHYQGAPLKLNFFSKPTHPKSTQAIAGWTSEQDKSIQGPLVIPALKT